MEKIYDCGTIILSIGLIIMVLVSLFIADKFTFAYIAISAIGLALLILGAVLIIKKKLAK